MGVPPAFHGGRSNSAGVLFVAVSQCGSMECRWDSMMSGSVLPFQQGRTAAGNYQAGSRKSGSVAIPRGSPCRLQQVWQSHWRDGHNVGTKMSFAPELLVVCAVHAGHVQCLHLLAAHAMSADVAIPAGITCPAGLQCRWQPSRQLNEDAIKMVGALLLQGQ